jgi:hypothetical protein
MDSLHFQVIESAANRILVMDSLHFQVIESAAKEILEALRQQDLVCAIGDSYLAEMKKEDLDGLATYKVRIIATRIK